MRVARCDGAPASAWTNGDACELQEETLNAKGHWVSARREKTRSVPGTALAAGGSTAAGVEVLAMSVVDVKVDWMESNLKGT
jgi:hypothetical protein